MKTGDEIEKRKKNKKRKRGDDSEDEFDPIKYQLEKKQKVAKRQKAEPNKTHSQLAKERALEELTKVSMVQAKLSKIKNRPTRVTATAEDDDFGKGKDNANRKNKKRSSRFEKDLTDISKKGVKKLR